MGRNQDPLSAQAMMASSGGEINFLYVDDGEQWAKFLSARLMGEKYGIKSILTNFSQKSLFEQTQNNDYSSNPNKLGANGTIYPTNVDNGSENIKLSQTTVIILSPDILSNPSFPIDLNLLNPRKTVLLLLGVDIEDVRFYFKDTFVKVFDNRSCIIHSDTQSITDAMVEIIYAYEYQCNEIEVDDYDELPYPRQLNGIETMITQELFETNRDVYFLLERQADGDVIAVLNEGSKDSLPVHCISDRLYKFTLPDNVRGHVSFNLSCDNYNVGNGSVQVITKFDQLKAVLNYEVEPLSLLASALGLQSNDLDSIDTALESKLLQLSSAEFLQKMFPFDESLDGSTSSDVRADVTYPTLLHFAADWNLRKFCSQLLRYPGMFDAALLENKDGDDPRTLAFNKGFKDMENDLIQFVMNNETVNCDEYVNPSSAVIRPPPPPRPHSMSNKSPGYVNMRSSNSSLASNSNYIQMDRKKNLSDEMPQPRGMGPLSPVSNVSDDVFTDRSSFSGEDLDYDLSMFNTRDTIERLSQSTSITPSKKALKTLGIKPEELLKSTSGRIFSRPEAPFTKPLSDNVSHGVRYHGNTFGSKDRINIEPEHQFEPPLPISKHKTNKVTKFINKIINKRSSSDGDDHSHYLGGKKPSSSRADKPKKKFTDFSLQERDSGSYTDEEHSKQLSTSGKKYNKPREFKERDKPMSRHRPLSKRIKNAKEDRIQDAPKVPTSIGRSRFTSFVETF